MKKFLSVTMLFVLAAFLLAACAGDGNQNQTPAAGEGSGMELTPAVTDDLGGPIVETPVDQAPVATEVPADVAATPTDETGDTGETGDELAGASFNDSAYRFSAIDNVAVTNANNDDLGDVEGFVIDSQSGQILYAIVGAGGFLGIGESEILVPWSAMNTDQFVATGEVAADAGNTNENANNNDNTSAVPVTGDRVFTLNVDEDTLSGAPTFDVDAMGDAVTVDWDADVRSYWEGAGVTSTVQDVDMSQVVVLRDVTDLQVVNQNDEDLGDIEDFVVDPTMGVVQYAILAAGGVADAGECFLPVPWAALQWNFEGQDGTSVDTTGNANDTAGSMNDNAAGNTNDNANGNMNDNTNDSAGLGAAQDAINPGGNAMFGGPYVVTLPITADDLTTAPCFDSLDVIPDPAVAGWDADVTTFWSGFDFDAAPAVNDNSNGG